MSRIRKAVTSLGYHGRHRRVARFASILDVLGSAS